MIDEYVDFIKSRMAELEPGKEVGVKELFGARWDEISSPKAFGHHFKVAVENGTFPGIVHIGFRNSGRFDVYRKN